MNCLIQHIIVQDKDGQNSNSRWEDYIIMDLEEIDIGAGNWIDLAHDSNHWRAVVNAALNLRVS